MEVTGEEMELPRYMALLSCYNMSYLQYRGTDMAFAGKDVVSAYTKFEVERSKNHKGLVHIRCCYNNKYWVKGGKVSVWIVAGADESDEDPSSWSCTLFEPVLVDGSAQTFRFRHVQLGKYVGILWTSSFLALWSTPSPSQSDVCKVIDWGSIVILPKHIAFKGDNGQYLSVQAIEGHPYLEFSSNDLGDPTVGNEVFVTHDGSVRIKSDYYGKFWRRNNNWIWADSDDSSDENANTLFWPVKVEENVVALRNAGNNNYCKRLSDEGKTNCLNAAVSTISKDARLGIGERILSRNIYNVDFRLMDAKIYNQSVITMTSADAVNTTNEQHTQDVTLSYEQTKSRAWKGSVSLQIGGKVTIQSGVPFISNGTLEISVEFNGGYEWGATESETTKVETVYKVTVPPMTRVILSMIATQASCDVPFSYTQRDLLMNGKYVIYSLDDGVYTGVNSFNVKIHIKDEKL